MNGQPKNGNKLAYLLPNLFTAASLFLGILSVIASSKTQFLTALGFIILSLFLDGMDGRVARMTNTTSKFGVEFDSLADLVAFGVAPALLFYFAIGHDFGRLGSLAAAVFALFGAIRLARFNVSTSKDEPGVFIGLPIPITAVVLALWTVIYTEFKGPAFAICVIALSFALSFLMVSNIRYPSFKKIELARSSLLKVLILLIVTFSLIWLYPLYISAAIASGYVFFGLIRVIYAIFKHKKIMFGRKSSEVKEGE